MSVAIILETDIASGFGGAQIASLSSEFDILELVRGPLEDMPLHIAGNPLQSFLATIRLANGADWPSLEESKIDGEASITIDAREALGPHCVTYLLPHPYKYIDIPFHFLPSSPV
jgi:hypothetical protein